MSGFTVKYLILLIAQALISSYFNFSQFVMATLLPAMILFLPLSRGPMSAMCTAFMTGLAIDFVCTGRIGLTSLALVPVAYMRRSLIMIVFGPELLSRGENMIFQRLGKVKIVLASAIACAIFLLIYILADSAGTRPLWIDGLKFAASLPVNILLSTYVAYIFCSDNNQKWK